MGSQRVGHDLATFTFTSLFASLFKHQYIVTICLVDSQHIISVQKLSKCSSSEISSSPCISTQGNSNTLYLNGAQLSFSQPAPCLYLEECISLFRKTRNHDFQFLLLHHQPQVKKPHGSQDLNVSFKYILIFLFWFSIYSLFSVMTRIYIIYNS